MGLRRVQVLFYHSLPVLVGLSSPPVQWKEKQRYEEEDIKLLDGCWPLDYYKGDSELGFAVALHSKPPPSHQV